MTTLRIATLNVWNKSGPWSERLRLIRAEITRLSPPILGLQEILRFAPDGERFSATAENCQATEIAQGFDYRVAYAAASDYGGGLKFGNALLSRFPILREEAYLLPGLVESGESRSLLYTLLDTPFGALPVFVTHLNWKFHQGNIRLRQVRFIAERIQELAPVRGPALPPVLMGDFNAEPEADEIRYLRGLAVVEGQSVFFADAWVHGGDGSLGATYHRDNDYARTAREPSRRIDYIFVRGPDSVLRGEPMRTEVAFATAEIRAAGAIWPSDHFGVVSDVYFAPRTP